MTEDARVELKCPECGAPLPPAAATAAVVCARCGTTSKPAPKGPEKIVQTVVVERVVVQGAAADAIPTAPACPRCGVTLFPARAKDVTVLGCGLCGGIWLDNAGSTAITKHADPTIARLAENADAHASLQPPTRDDTLDCPICRQRMARVSPSRLVALDVCTAHGTWFDAGELRRVMNAYHAKDDDPFGAVRVVRDPVEARLQSVAAASAPAPLPWSFEDGTAGAKIADVGVAFLGGVLLGAVGKR